MLINLQISQSGTITTINCDHAAHCTALKDLPVYKYMYVYFRFRTICKNAYIWMKSKTLIKLKTSRHNSS